MALRLRVAGSISEEGGEPSCCDAENYEVERNDLSWLNVGQTSRCWPGSVGSAHPGGQVDRERERVGVLLDRIGSLRVVASPT